MRVFALKSCDTCRKALTELRAAGHDPQVIDVRSDGIGAVDLVALLAAHGATAINRASTTWRGLTQAERAAGPAPLLVAHPTLLKRPAIETGGVWTLGWGPEVRARYLKS